MEGELACEELRTQCTYKEKMGYVPSVLEFPTSSRKGEKCDARRLFVTILERFNS
jgi:hypothetical protein